MPNGKDTSKRSRDFLSDDMLGKWRFLELVVAEQGGSEDILKVKAARTARRLKGLTLRFWKSGDAALQLPDRKDDDEDPRNIHNKGSPYGGYTEEW